MIHSTYEKNNSIMLLHLTQQTKFCEDDLMQKTTFELSTFQEYIWIEGIHLYCAKLQKHLLLQYW